MPDATEAELSSIPGGSADDRCRDVTNGDQSHGQSVARPPPPQRDVARPITNLGNTCYMNAVLQALAHAPELCMAMDVEPHFMTCPTFLRHASLRQSSPSSSPDSVVMPPPPPPPLRKSKRSSGKRSPTTTQQQERERLVQGSNDSKRAEEEIKFCALCELEQHLLRVHQSNSSSMRDNKPIAPTSFVNGFISHVAPWFQLGVQEDSHEFMRILIDAMQTSCKNARTANKNGNASKEKEKEPDNSVASEQGHSNRDDPTQSGGTDEDNDESGKQSNEKIAKVEEKPVLDNEYPFRLFRGLVESNVKCESCNASSSTIDPIEDIGLEVLASPSSPSPKVSNELSDVGSAFRRFARPEALDSGYKCEKCGKFGRATKQSRLASVPPILTLHLKRFRYGEAASLSSSGPAPRRSNRTSEVGQLLGASAGDFYGGKSGSAKIEGHAKFDQIFDIHPFLTSELQSKLPNMICRLFAVIVHAGKNSHSGHYYSYVHHLNKNEWWKMDDSRVTLASTQEVMGAEAYMLLYRVAKHEFSLDLRDRSKKLLDDLPETTGQNGGHQIPGTTRECPSPVSVFTMKDSCTAPSVSDDPQKDSSDVQLSSRKRKAPEYANGEEWARAKTNLPESFIKKFAGMEQVVSEFISFKPNYFQHISALASKTGAKVGDGPNTVATEEDVTDSQETIRAALIELLYKFSRECEQNGRPMIKSPKHPPASNAAVLPPSSVRGTKVVTTMVEPDSENYFH